MSGHGPTHAAVSGRAAAATSTSAARPPITGAYLDRVAAHASASREGRFARLGVVPDHVLLDAGRGMGEATRLLAVLGERHVATDCDELVGVAARPANDCLGDLVASGVVTKEQSDGRPGVQQRRVEESRFQDAICCVVTAR